MFCATVKAQTTTKVSSIPFEYTAADTNTNILELPQGYYVELHIMFPSGNAGTVQINTESSSMSTSPAMSAETNPSGVILKARNTINVKMTNSGDKIWIVVWK